jgi:hypothetical protein
MAANPNQSTFVPDPTGPPGGRFNPMGAEEQSKQYMNPQPHRSSSIFGGKKRKSFLIHKTRKHKIHKYKTHKYNNNLHYRIS